MATNSSVYSDQTVAVIRRLFALADLLASRRYGVTRFDIYTAFPDEYAGGEAANERKFHRDMRVLRELGRVEVINAGGSVTGGAPAVYIAPEHAHYRMEERDG